LQRLFSTFPDSWPGFGLLLLRIGIGIALVYTGISNLMDTHGPAVTIAQNSIEAAGGIFLLVGLWTPVAGALVAVDELCLGIFAHRRDHIFLAVVAACIAMVGPGAWSIDARLFGRKRFRMADGTRGKKPQ
jgi:putative oxidoreductase